MKPELLVAICVKPGLAPPLRDRCYELASRIPQSNVTLNVTVVFYHAAIEEWPAGPDTPWARVAVARNELLNRVNRDCYDYLLCVDADLVAYPYNFPSMMLERNPHGINAPLVLIEDSERFYDTAAFIVYDQCDIEPENRAVIPGRNLVHDEPYWPPGAPGNSQMPMDCVGTFVMYPMGLVMAMGAEPFRNHAAFTDHFALCRRARETGHRVLCHRDLVAWHADLPRYGESWH